MKTITKKSHPRSARVKRAMVAPTLTKEAEEILAAANRVGNARIFRPVYEIPSQRYMREKEEAKFEAAFAAIG